MTDLLFGKRNYRGGETALTPWIAPLACTGILDPRASPFPHTRIAQILALSKPDEDVILKETIHQNPPRANIPHTLLISDGTTSIVAHVSPIARKELQKWAERDGAPLRPGTLLRFSGHRLAVVDAKAPKVLPPERTVIMVPHQLPNPPKNNALFHNYAALAPGRAVEAIFLDLYHDVVVLGQGPLLPHVTPVLEDLDVRRALQEADQAVAQPASRDPGPYGTLGDVPALFSRSVLIEGRGEQNAIQNEEFWSFIASVPPLVLPTSVPTAAPTTEPMMEDAVEEIIVIADDDDDDDEEDMGIGNMLVEEDDEEIPSATQEDQNPPKTGDVQIDAPPESSNKAVESSLVRSAPPEPSGPVHPMPGEAGDVVDLDASLVDTQPLLEDASKPTANTPPATNVSTMPHSVETKVPEMQSPKKKPNTTPLDAPKAMDRAFWSRLSTADSMQNTDPIDLTDHLLGVPPIASLRKPSVHASERKMYAMNDVIPRESADPETILPEDQSLETQPSIHPPISSWIPTSQDTIDAVNELIEGSSDPPPKETAPKGQFIERPARHPGPPPKKMLRLGGDALRSLFMFAC